MRRQAQPGTYDLRNYGRDLSGVVARFPPVRRQFVHCVWKGVREVLEQRGLGHSRMVLQSLHNLGAQASSSSRSEIGIFLPLLIHELPCHPQPTC